MELPERLKDRTLRTHIIIFADACIAPVGLGLRFMPCIFRQDYRILVNSALTGNDRDCRISDC